MALTTHEKIRVEAGFQGRNTRQPFITAPDGVASTFYVTTDDAVKFVPEFGTGNTIAGISDVQVFTGLSGIQGSSQMVVSAIDIDTGAVTLDTVPDLGASLTITYASSSIPDADIETMRLRAEGTVNERLGICYDLPLSPVPSRIEDLVTRLAAAHLLIRNYGTNSRDTASDGYMLYDQLMGAPQKTVAGNRQNNFMVYEVGEIGMICTPDYRLFDDNGNEVPRTDLDNNTVGIAANNSGLSGGRIYDISEEPFRYKKYQIDVNRQQPGTGNVPSKEDIQP